MGLSFRSIRIVTATAVMAGLGAVCASLPVASASEALTPTHEAESLRVELTAPASCPPRPTLFERVRAHTPRVREAAGGESSRALRVVVTSEGDRFVADLHLVEEDEALERRVRGKTCEEVLAAVALITALAIDPLASTVPTDAGGPVEDAASAPDASVARSIVVDADGGPPRSKRARVRGSIGVSLEAHGLGELVLGRSIWLEGALAAGISPAVRLRLGQTQSFTEERDLRRASFVLTTVAVDGCMTALRSKAELEGTSMLELRPCAGVAGGVLEGASSAFGVHRMPRPWVSLGAMLQGRLRIFGPLALEAALGLSFPLVRDNFFFLPRNDVYRAPDVVLLGNVGVGTTFR